MITAPRHFQTIAKPSTYNMPGVDTNSKENALHEIINIYFNIQFGCWWLVLLSAPLRKLFAENTLQKDLSFCLLSSAANESSKKSLFYNSKTLNDVLIS